MIMEAQELSLNLFGEPVSYDEPVVEVTDDDKLHKHELFDWVRSVKESKIDLRKEYITVTRGKGDKKRTIKIPPDPELKSLDMYMLISALSQNIDLAPIANIMNKMHYLPKDMQYVFLLTAIPATKSYDKWVKKELGKQIKQMVEVMKLTQKEAEDNAYVFTPEEIDEALKAYKEEEKCKQNPSKKC